MTIYLIRPDGMSLNFEEVEHKIVGSPTIIYEKKIRLFHCKHGVSCTYTRGIRCIYVRAGEKMSISVTIYLTFAVFLNVVSSLLPASSKSVCIISIYLLYHLCQGAVIIILTCLQLRMLDWNDIRIVPRVVRSLTLYSFKFRCRSRSKINSKKLLYKRLTTLLKMIRNNNTLY